MGNAQVLPLPKILLSMIYYTFIHHGHCLGQIEEAAVEKLVAFLDINAMRENPMVRTRL